METTMHPLIGQLRPIFSELHASTPETLPSVILKLEYIVEEEKDALFHHSSMKSSSVNFKVLPKWLNKQLRQLFEKPETELAGVRCLRVLLDVEYVDLNEMTRFFSELLIRCVLETQTYAIALEAAEVWGLVLNNGSSAIEGIINSCLRFSTVHLLPDAELHEGRPGDGMPHNDGGDGAMSGAGPFSLPSVLREESGDMLDSSAVPTALTTTTAGGSASPSVKLTACLLLQQLVRRVPSVIISELERILEGLRASTADSDKLVRVNATDSLRHALCIAYRSADMTYCQRWQDILLDDVVRQIHSGPLSGLHGSLLVFNAVLSSVTASDTGGRVVKFSVRSHTAVLCVWDFVNDKLPHPMTDSDLQQVILNTLPLLAQYDKHHFTKVTADQMVGYAKIVFNATTGSDERPMVFDTLGRLMVVLPELVLSYIGHIIGHIKSSLTKRPQRERCLEAVSCFATVSEVQPRAVRPFLRHILGPLFSGSITEGFARDVARICAVFPELRSTCLSKMLDATKAQLQALQQRPVTTFAATEQARRFILDNLNALGSLDFTGYSTLPFLCDCVVRYILNPHEDIRRRAIDLCFRLIHSGCSHSPCERTEAGAIAHRGREHIRLVCTVVKKLVNAAVADSESVIRLHTLESFSEAHDDTLALQDVASALFPALYDKYHNRIAAVRLLGRISTRNPACIYPMLRRVMVQCVVDIQYFENSKKQEQATAVLSAVVESAPEMVRPYVPSLLHNCVARLKDRTQPEPVITALLSCVGKLARLAEGDDVAVVTAVRPYVLSHILDSSSIRKKQEAIRALGDIIRTTKDVDVYSACPELLRVLLSALHGGFKEAWPVRLDVLKLMGIIGAVDPVRVKEILRESRDSAAASVADLAYPTGSGGEAAIAQNVARFVLEVLRLPSLTDEQCLSAVTVIANTFSVKEVMNDSFVPYYSNTIASILSHARAQSKIRGKLLRVLTRIVHLVRRHVRSHLDEILTTVIAFIPSAERGVLVDLLNLLVELRRCLREEFRPCLSQLLPPVVMAVQSDPEAAGEPVFAFFVEMGTLLDDFLHIVLPCVCDAACNWTYSLACRTAAVDAIGNFAKQLPRLATHASRCIHCLCRVLRELEPSMRSGSDVSAALRQEVDLLVAVSLDAIRDVARNLGGDFEKFCPTVFPVLNACGKDGLEVANAITAFTRTGGGVVAVAASHTGDDSALGFCGAPDLHRRKVEQPDHFMSVCNVLLAGDRDTEDGWNLWLKQLSVELLRCSPSPFHGFAYPLAQVHEPFARHMLHSAFAACYGEMDPSTRVTVTNQLGTVLCSKRLPSEVLQELLNLSEYMERAEMRFNPKEGAFSSHTGVLYDLNTLMDSSERCNLYAKALWYVEIQFYQTTHEYEQSVMRGRPQPLPPDEWRCLLQLCEKSIYLCNLLGQRESADGMLTYIQMNFSFMTGRPQSELPRMMDAQLFEKLQWWSQSLKAYQQRLPTEPNLCANMAGLMRSLDNLGDYGRLLESWKLFAPRVSRKDAGELAPYAAHAAWLLRDWDEMEKMTNLMPDEGYLGTTATFYGAVLATHKRQFHEAKKLIHQCRKRLDSILSALIGESYDRAYTLLVGIQQLSELEEVALIAKGSRGIHHWQELWEKRLLVMGNEGWAGTLANHTLVISPTRELGMWLRFVLLSRTNGRERAATEVLYELLGSQSIPGALSQPVLPQPAIALAAVQHLYEIQEREQAIGLLNTYVSEIEAAGLEGWKGSKREDFALCHARLADWLFSAWRKSGTLYSSSRVDEILHHLQRATDLDACSGPIWHTWARFNHELVSKAHVTETSREHFANHVTCAVEGYLRSVCLSPELEDVLGFLSLWFSYGTLPQMQSSTSIASSMKQVSATVWLKVIPQIIARIHSQDAVMSESVYHLLVIIAASHPQALLYSLTVTNSFEQGTGTNEQMERRRAGQRILSKIMDLHRNGRTMVSDAALVCRELVRCAVLWTELWFDELERAWYQWGREKSPQNVLSMLQPLVHQLKFPETMAESHFVAEFGELLCTACESVQRAVALGNHVYMEEAWSRFKTVVKRIDEQISGMTSLSLQLVSPKLLQSGKNLSLVVPGQYQESGTFPRIASFQSTLKVMNSKQHPRRLYINGTDGVLYKFLLKGHEDLRLDERVMQLLAFVNTLLEKHSAVPQRDSMIQVYSVTPLSDNAGLVGWVDNCDTLHQLIREHRGHSKYLSIEINLMLSIYEDLDRLRVIQHIEPFEFALERTEGADLANSLWMRAQSTEVWLDRRTTYVRSLAAMSMVGHILGLGDRHPSNLMIHAFSGRVVHIDFGDCFEVAMTRSAYPEKVPFRLTRMLVKTMGMGGIEGLFRHGCVTVMNVLREEGNSILALLEAFVHDPLVSWWRDDPEVDGQPDEGVSPGRNGSSRLTPEGSEAYTTLGMSFRKPANDGTSSGIYPMSSRMLPSSKSLAPQASMQKRVQSIGPDAIRHQTRKAQQVVHRIKEKLEGREFPALGVRKSSHGQGDEGLKTEAQVSRLIEEATSNENLCVHFQGWCPFW